MRRHIPLLLLLLLLGVPLSVTAPGFVVPRCVAPAWAGQPLDEKLFKRGQPYVHRLVAWDGRVVVQADRFYVLDLGRAVASPLDLPGTREVIDVTTWGKDRALALCRADGGLRLLVRHGTGWDELALPTKAHRAATPLTIRADRTGVVLLAGDVLFRWAAGVWESVQIRPPPLSHTLMQGRGVQPDHALLAGGRLYLGYDRGEWGGALLSLDVRTGRWEDIDLGDGGAWPVRDLRVGPGGQVWVAEGLAHLILAAGRLSSGDGKGWRTNYSLNREGPDARGVPPTPLDGVAFDGEGRLVLLGGSVGLVRRKGPGWRRLTPHWPEFAFVRGLHVTPAGLAVVGLTDGGVLLIDLKSGRARRVVLREAGEAAA